MRKIITFLGTTARETRYEYEGHVYVGHVFAEALRQAVDFDAMLVFTTEAAAETTWPVLAGLEDPRIRRVDIPVGRDPAELWALFDCLTQEVAAGDAVIFDITHGLRSIPFLVFLAAAYLKEARAVTLEAIFYGAYELGQPAPVIDLSEFVALLDWTTATNRFLATGDAQQLVDLLTAAHSLPWRHREAYAQSDLPTRLQGMGGTLHRLSQALRLARPEDVMARSESLCATLDAVRPEVERWAKPFGVLLERTQRDYRALALPGDPRAPEQAVAGLRVQRELVGWYVSRRQYVQAIVLAREWLVSYTALLLGWDLIQDRRIVEDALHAGAGAVREGQPLPAVLRDLPQAQTLASFWNRLPDLRNDIAHVGMRASPRPVASIVKAARALPDQLQALALPGEGA